MDSSTYFSLSCWKNEILEDIKLELQSMPSLIDQIRKEHLHVPCTDFYERDGLFYYKGKIYLHKNSTIIPKIIQELHASPIGGHSGMERTLHRIRTTFWWKAMRQTIRHFVSSCIICQQMKTPTTKPQGLLMPLPIPSAVWQNISMDFITGLPLRKGKSVIIVVVDRLTKFCHLGALTASYTATQVAEFFVHNIIKLHGIPDSIVSDRDRVFTSKFWKELHRLSGTSLLMSSAYHPQTDGQTEVTNRSLEMFLRSLVFDEPKKWLDMLPWAELWFNSSYNSTIGMTPFMALYGREAPTIPGYMSGDSHVVAVDEDLQRRDHILNVVKQNMLKTQARMKHWADQHRNEVIFLEGDWVLVRLPIYRQLTAGHRLHHKFGQRYFRPFQISKKINDVAFQLELPKDAQVHPVFHVSRIKKFIGPSPSQPGKLPQLLNNNQVVPLPIAILNERTIIKNGQPAQEVLVQWEGLDLNDTSWEVRKSLTDLFPSINLEDKVGFKGGGDDTCNTFLAAKDAINFLTDNGTIGIDSDNELVEPEEEVTSMEGRRTRQNRNKKPIRYEDYSME